jgi:hypothetical protein
MNIYQVAGLIFVFGAAGGIVNCIVLGAHRVLPAYDGEKIWHPGWAGNLFLGGIASVLIWGIYGSSASFDLLGKTPFEGHLTVAQLLTSVVVGMGGSRILTLELQKLILRSQRDIEEAAKENVVSATKIILFEPEDD